MEDLELEMVVKKGSGGIKCVESGGPAPRSARPPSAKESLWDGWVRLKNGWVLELPPMAPDTRLPVTVEARKRE